MVGPWLTNPWQLVSQSHGAVAWRFRPPYPSHVPFSFASSRHRPVPRVPWTPHPVAPLCGSSHTPFPAPSPCPIIPCFYPTGSPATLWRGPTGASSFRGPLRALSMGRSLPAPVPFPCAAAPASSPRLSCGPIPSLIPCLYPTGPPATLWRGPTGFSSIRGPFRASSTGRSLPAPFPCAAAPAYSPGLLCGPIPSLIPCLYPTRPPATLWRGPTGSSSMRGPFCAPSTGRSPPAHAPLSCAACHAVLVPWGRRVALATRPFLSRLLVVLRGVVRVFFLPRFFPRGSLLPACTHNNTASPSVSVLFGALVQSHRHPVARPLAVPGHARRLSLLARVDVHVSSLSPLYPPLPSVSCPPS